jgi:hypothetical protein
MGLSRDAVVVVWETCGTSPVNKSTGVDGFNRGVELEVSGCGAFLKQQ